MLSDRNAIALNPNEHKVTPCSLPAEMQSIVFAAAEPWRPGMTVKEAVGRSARTLGISYRRAYTFWYRAPAAVLAHEADQMRAWHRRYIANKKARLAAEIAELDREWERIGECLAE